MFGSCDNPRTPSKDARKNSTAQDSCRRPLRLRVGMSTGLGLQGLFRLSHAQSVFAGQRSCLAARKKSSGRPRKRSAQQSEQVRGGQSCGGCAGLLAWSPRNNGGLRQLLQHALALRENVKSDAKQSRRRCRRCVNCLRGSHARNSTRLAGIDPDCSASQGVFLRI